MGRCWRAESPGKSALFVPNLMRVDSLRLPGEGLQPNRGPVENARFLVFPHRVYGRSCLSHPNKLARES